MFSTIIIKVQGGYFIFLFFNTLYCSDVENNRLRKIMTKWQKYRELVVLSDLNLSGNDTIIQQRLSDKFSRKDHAKYILILYSSILFL